MWPVRFTRDISPQPPNSEMSQISETLDAVVGTSSSERIAVSFVALVWILWKSPIHNWYMSVYIFRLAGLSWWIAPFTLLSRNSTANDAPYPALFQAHEARVLQRLSFTPDNKSSFPWQDWIVEEGDDVFDEASQTFRRHRWSPQHNFAESCGRFRYTIHSYGIQSIEDEKRCFGLFSDMEKWGDTNA